MIQVLTTKVLLKRSIASIKKSSVNNNYTKRSLKKIFNNGFNSEERCFSTFHSWNFNRISNFPCSAKLKCLAKPPFLAGTNFSINGVLGHINYYNYNNVKYYSSSASKKEEEDEDDLNDLSQDAEEDYDDQHIRGVHLHAEQQQALLLLFVPATQNFTLQVFYCRRLHEH